MASRRKVATTIVQDEFETPEADILALLLPVGEQILAGDTFSVTLSNGVFTLTRTRLQREIFAATVERE